MWLLLVACAHVVSVTSSPAGASLLRDGQPAGNAPTEIHIAPFRAAHLVASLPGHQTLETVVRPRWWQARATVELRLSPERPPLQ